MSKPKTPRQHADHPDDAPVTADSSLTDILREKIRVRAEIIRHERYKELLVLRDQLAKLPPLIDEDLD